MLTDNELKNGDDLSEAIQSGEVICDTGARWFVSKPFEEDSSLAGLPVRVTTFAVSNNSRFSQFVDHTFYLTGRKCWAFDGRGNAYEAVSRTKPQVIWASHLNVYNEDAHEQNR